MLSYMLLGSPEDYKFLGNKTSYLLLFCKLYEFPIYLFRSSEFTVPSVNISEESSPHLMNRRRWGRWVQICANWPDNKNNWDRLGRNAQLAIVLNLSGSATGDS